MAGPTEKRKTDPAETSPAKHRGWKAMPYIIGTYDFNNSLFNPVIEYYINAYFFGEISVKLGNETFEKLGTLGTSSNLLVYLTTIFHLKSVTAATLLNVFNGTTNIAPLLGAFLSDSYLGRYFTLGFASVASLTGMFILTLTAGIASLHPPECDQGQHCRTPTPWQLTVLLGAFAFLVVGAGGIRPCNLAFGADQFNPHTDSGRRGIASFFNWYYFTFTFSMMISATVIIYVQSNISWTLGLAIPTVLMFFSCAFFFVGTRIYVRVKPEGSPFTSIAQVIAAAIRKRGLDHPEDPKNSLYNPPHVSSLNSKLPYTDQFRFVDKASIVQTNDIDENGLVDNPWRLCTLQQVEEVKCLLRIIPIWSAGLMFNIAMVQQSNYVVFQAIQSDRRLFNTRFEIPAGSFTIFTMLALTIWLPTYDRAILPCIRRVFRNEEGITMLQRMGIGIILSIIAMVTCATVEERRRSYALHRPTVGIASAGGAISSMSSLWLVPQLVIIGLGEAFNVIGQIEFYYKQFPENMRSIAGSMFFCSLAVSNYLSGLMVTVVHRVTGGEGKLNWLAQDLNMGRLDYFYFLIAAMGVLNLAYFIACASWYRYKTIDGVGEIGLETNKAKAPPV